MRLRLLPCAGLLGLTLCAQPGAAQPQDPPLGAGQVRRSGVLIYFGEEIELGLLAYVAAEAIATPLEYDPEKLTGNVRMQASLGYTSLEVWELFNRELAVRGMTTIQPPDSPALRVVATEQAASLARLEAEDL